MNQPPSDAISAVCDDSTGLYVFEQSTGPDPTPSLPNAGNMGVVTLSEDGTYISRRPLNEFELEAAWSEHKLLHGSQPIITAHQRSA